MISRFNHADYVKNLPDAYKKTPESNNAKLLEIEKGSNDLLREEIKMVADSLDLELATGKTLDLYGEMLGQDRGAATDEQYRALLKSSIVRTLSGSDYNSVVNAICVTFDCSPSDLILTESDGGCSVSLDGIPLDAINRINIDANTAAQIVKTLMPVGVHFTSLNFSGTFEFGKEEMEYDEAKGFGDVAQTIGGTLGYAPDTDSTLPV